MKNELEAIVIGLEEAGLNKSRETLITALQMLEQELLDMGQSMKNAMHDCIDIDDFTKLKKLQQLNVLIQATCKDLHTIPEATRYDNNKPKKAEKPATDVKDVTNRSPMAIIIAGTRIDLPKDTWLSLLENVLRYCAKASMKRYEEMVQEFNYTSGIVFLKDPAKATRSYAHIIEIPEANQYIEIHGSSENLLRLSEGILEFYNLKGQYEILLNNKVRNKRK